MSQPLVSINIPVFKCEKYIYRCLESVQNQSYKNLEIILINDATPDNSIQVIEDFFKENPDLNYRLLHNETNEGLSVVRNKGIENSTGKYIYMLDSDDYLTTDCIEKLVQISEKENSDITVGETICLDSKDNQEKLLFPIRSKESFFIGNDNILNQFFDNQWPIIAPNKLYRRDWILKNNLRFVKGLYSQDELWSFHCVFHLDKIAFLKEVTYIYFLHGESTIYNKKKINFENHQTIVEWFTKKYHKVNSSQKKLIKKKLVGFKDTSLQMQWKSMRNDEEYWKQNYARYKKAPGLSFFDYFSPHFSNDLKKKNFFLNLPSELGFQIFKWRYRR